MGATLMGRHWQDRSRYYGDGRRKRGRELPKAPFREQALWVESLFRAILRQSVHVDPRVLTEPKR